MNNVLTLRLDAPTREQVIANFGVALHQCVAEVIEELGVRSFQDFFDGYRLSIEEQKIAA